jgi:hypothetical protein
MTMWPEPKPEIRAVLDRSAIQSYVNGHIHVGELVSEVTTEKGVYVGIPAAALAEAHVNYLGDDHAKALLRLLTTLPGTTVLDLDSQTAPEIAGSLRLTNGDMSRAHAVWAANKLRAQYFTTEPEEVKSLVPDQNVVLIPTEDA